MPVFDRDILNQVRIETGTSIIEGTDLESYPRVALIADMMIWCIKVNFAISASISC